MPKTIVVLEVDQDGDPVGRSTVEKITGATGNITWKPGVPDPHTDPQGFRKKLREELRRLNPTVNFDEE